MSIFILFLVYFPIPMICLAVGGEEAGAAAFGIEIGVTIVGFIIYGYISNALEKRKQEKIQRNLLEQKKVDMDNKKAMDIYEAAMQRDVNLNDESQVSNLFIIAKQYGIEDIVIAKEYYYRGKALIEQNKKERILKQNNEKRSKEVEIYKNDEKNAKIIGKEKYLAKVYESYNRIKKAEEANEHMKTKANLNSHYYPKEKDWAIAGGIANGIAGSVAGVAVAMETQLENQKSKERAKEIREAGENNYAVAVEMSYKIRQKKRICEKIIGSMENVVCDDSNKENKFKKITFGDCKIRLLDSKNFEVKCCVKKVKVVELFGKNAILDGSIRINILNSSNEVVANGYYSAPGYGVLKSENIGFLDNSEFSAICVPNDYSKISENEKYTCVLCPEQLWYVESFNCASSGYEFSQSDLEINIMMALA